MPKNVQVTSNYIVGKKKILQEGDIDYKSFRIFVEWTHFVCASEYFMEWVGISLQWTVLILPFHQELYSLKSDQCFDISLSIFFRAIISLSSCVRFLFTGQYDKNVFFFHLDRRCFIALCFRIRISMHKHS